MGSTACGKTDLAVNIAKKFNAEIINADAMQLYKEMNIGVNKVCPHNMQGIKHHLLGFLSVKESFSVSEFVFLARKIAKEIQNRGKLIILCGGTGLYIDNFLKNNTFLNMSVDFSVRKKLEERAQKIGCKSLLLELKKIDPLTASKLHENDKKRILRALEIYYTTSKTLSFQNEVSKKRKKIYDICKIGLAFSSREKLYEKINLRVDKMIQEGLENEARMIFNLAPSKTAAKAIGYREFFDYFKGNTSLSETIEKIKINTRHYAKKQITWFKKDKDVAWIFIDKEKNFDEVISKAENVVKNFIGNHLQS
jgi:tRNA dimethylallyltransferase